MIIIASTATDKIILPQASPAARGTEPIGSAPLFVGESMCLQNKAFASLLKKAAKLENLIVQVPSHIYHFPPNGNYEGNFYKRKRLREMAAL